MFKNRNHTTNIYRKIFENETKDEQYCDKSIKYIKRVKTIALIVGILTLISTVIFAVASIKSGQTTLKTVILILILLDMGFIVFYQVKVLSKNIENIKIHISNNL